MWDRMDGRRRRGYFERLGGDMSTSLQGKKGWMRGRDNGRDRTGADQVSGIKGVSTDVTSCELY